MKGLSSLAFLAIGGAVVLAFGCGEPKLLIAVAGDMNNAGGDFGHHFADGFTAALQNDTIQIQYLDDKDDPETARQQAVSVIQDPRLVLVIGHSASATTSAAASIYGRAGVALVAPIATMDELFSDRPGPQAPTIFRLPPPNRYQARAIVRHLQSEPIEQVVVIYAEDGAYSASLERQLSEEWASPGSYARVDLTRIEPSDDPSILANRVLAEFRRLGGAADSRRAVIVTTYYRDAVTAFRAMPRVRNGLSTDVLAIGTDGTLHPGLGLPVGSDLLGAQFVFVGPSWQEFDPNQEIFNRYRWLHQQPGHPQREDQPTMYEAMWPSFISYGYLAGTLARRVLSEAGTSGPVTKHSVLHVLRNRSFDIGLPSVPRMSFEKGSDSAVMESQAFVVTVYRVKAVPPARRLDALWLEQIAHYAQKDLR